MNSGRGGNSPASNNNKKTEEPLHDVRLEDIQNDWESPREERIVLGLANISNSRPGSSNSGYMPKLKKKDFGDMNSGSGYRQGGEHLFKP